MKSLADILKAEWVGQTVDFWFSGDPMGRYKVKDVTIGKDGALTLIINDDDNLWIVGSGFLHELNYATVTLTKPVPKPVEPKPDPIPTPKRAVLVPAVAKEEKPKGKK